MGSFHASDGTIGKEPVMRTNPQSIHTVKLTAVVMEGEIIQGSLQ